MEELPWWKITRNSRHVRTTCETRVLLSSGGSYKSLDKGTFISPVRKSFLPWGHWAISYYDETRMIFAETPEGFGLIDLNDVDWY